MVNNTIIIGFCAAPNAQRTMIYQRILNALSQKVDVMGYSLDYENEGKMNTFESHYKTALRYMLKDIENRSLAREKNIGVLLYQFTPFDIIASTMAEQTIMPEYSKIIKSMLSEHVKKFPFSMVFYCEFFPVPKHYQDYDKKTIFQLRVDTHIIRQLETMPFETITKSDIDDRVKTALDLILQKCSKN